MDKKEVLQMVSESISLLPQEKYRLMVAIQRGKVSQEKLIELKDILEKEKKDIQKRVLEHREKCLNIIL